MFNHIAYTGLKEPESAECCWTNLGSCVTKSKIACNQNWRGNVKIYMQTYVTTKFIQFNQIDTFSFYFCSWSVAYHDPPRPSRWKVHRTSTALPTGATYFRLRGGLIHLFICWRLKIEDPGSWLRPPCYWYDYPERIALMVRLLGAVAISLMFCGLEI